MIYKKYLNTFLTVFNFLILYMFFFLFNKDTKKNSKCSEFIQVFGVFYNSSDYYNTLFSTAKKISKIGNDSYLKFEISEILFQNEAFLIENVSLSKIDRTVFLKYGLELKSLDLLKKVFC